MRFLVDENLACSCANAMRELGYEAVHVSEVGLTSTDDTEIVTYAVENGYIIITFDLDFSRIVALSRQFFPSIITFRMGEITVPAFRELILLNIPDLEDSLKQGVLVTIDPRGVRIQPLPITKK